jgi:hypothetical protein
MRERLATARQFLGWGTLALPVGIALSAVGQTLAGSVITVGALAVLIAGLHTYGRSGPDLGDAP